MKRITYQRMATVPVVDATESMLRMDEVELNDSNVVFIRETNVPKPESDPDEIFTLREGVVARLTSAASYLPDGYKLGIGYGYRRLSVQQRIFEKVLAQIVLANVDVVSTDLLEMTHNFIAVPEVSGHPTGGAVDVTLVTIDGDQLDMGSPFLDITAEEVQMSWNDAILNDLQLENRAMLLDEMFRAGFAPFAGEWWHYSYGDREWAAYYDKPNAIYRQINDNEII